MQKSFPDPSIRQGCRLGLAVVSTDQLLLVDRPTMRHSRGLVRMNTGRQDEGLYRGFWTIRIQMSRAHLNLRNPNGEARSESVSLESIPPTNDHG
jgi:hypothetical protein